jgi:hypothetical protein
VRAIWCPPFRPHWAGGATMTTYPEHGELAAVKDQTQAIGDFLEWLAGQRVQLMTWREDLTDERPTDPRCPLNTGAVNHGIRATRPRKTAPAEAGQ